MAGSMNEAVMPSSSSEMIERSTLCLPNYETGLVMHRGEHSFLAQSRLHFEPAQNDAAERLMALKDRLRDASVTDFWRLLMEGMTSIADAQFAFATKRILVDAQNAAVEMPPIGEPGSCLMAEAFFYNDGHGTTDLSLQYSYAAYGTPCAHMKHDKVFLIPDRFNELITNNPVQLPFPAEAYLALPLFVDGKCVAHFGIMWSPEGLRRRSLSWGYLEMFMHALEDLILGRLFDGQSFDGPGQAIATTPPPPVKVIPHDAILASQSLKPYARSLSHELRTPMQGVVGMLDVMQANIQESAAAVPLTPDLKRIFTSLREGIEVLQDSSKRAFEAADNVVHAYDLNMGVPLSPTSVSDGDSAAGGGEGSSVIGLDRALDMSPESPSYRPCRLPKRHRDEPIDGNSQAHPGIKHRATDGAVTSSSSMNLDETGVRLIARPEFRSGTSLPDPSPNQDDSTIHAKSRSSTPRRWDGRASVSGSGLKPTRLRQLLPRTLRESLQSGGRPDSVTYQVTHLGEDIQVCARDGQGSLKTKMVSWTIDPDVPITLSVDESDVGKLISCLVLNALKFTEEGSVSVKARVGRRGRHVLITVQDTGPGIPADFRPALFKPFSREDDSLTRQKDGLGLGLLVAKGIARKIRGDVLCLRSDTAGPRRGSEFEIRVPLEPSDANRSSPAVPLRTPTAAETTTTTTTTTTMSSLELDGGGDDHLLGCLPLVPFDQGLPSSDMSDGITPVMNDQSRSSPVRTEPIKSFAPIPTLSSSLSTSTIKVTDGSNPGNGDGSSNRLGGPSIYDRSLATKHPLTFLVVEDNQINRKLLVNMLSKLGYQDIYEAYDGVDAVRQMKLDLVPPVDVILMDLWMPRMDGYEATRQILSMPRYREKSSDTMTTTKTTTTTTTTITSTETKMTTTVSESKSDSEQTITIIAVTADVTDQASNDAAEVGMKGLMRKPFKLSDLQRAILEYCAPRHSSVPIPVPSDLVSSPSS